MTVAATRISRLRRPSRIETIWSAPALVLILVAIVIPVVVLTSDILDSHAALTTLTRPSVLAAVRFSTLQALWSTVITMVIGSTMAWILAAFDFPGRRFVSVVATIPFVLPTVVVAAAFLAVLPSSIERSSMSIIAAHVFFNISLVIRLVSPGWSVLDPDLLAAARTLGASPVHVIRRVLLPTARTALVSAAALVFIMSFTSYGIVRILGDPSQRTVEVEIYRRAVLLGDLSGASVLALAQTLVIVMFYALATRRSTPTLQRIEPTRRPAPAWARATAVIVTTLVATPLVAMIFRSIHLDGRWTLSGWRYLLTRTGPLVSAFDLPDVVGRSLVFACLAAAIAVPCGVAAAAGLARRPSPTIQGFLTLPMAASAVVVGFGILIAYDTDPFDFRSSWWLIPVIHAVVALPFVVRAALPVAESIPPGVRDAAAILGATPLRRWWAIDARLLAPACASGAGLSMALSLGEFGATSLLTRRNSATLPIVIDQLLGRAGGAAFVTAMAASTCLLIVTAIIVFALDTRLRS